MIDHDRLFKELLTTFFVEFLDLFLPSVRAYIEPGSITFLDKEVFTDVTAGEKGEVDILAKAKFREQDAFFLVHVENQEEPQAQFCKRMFHYFARLEEKHDLPVYPVALFTYTAPKRLEPDNYQVAFSDFTPLEFRFRSIQLSRLHWRDFVRQPNPVASALMAKMPIARQDRPKVKAECLRLLATLKLNPAKMQLISGFVDTYLRLTGEEERRFRSEIAAFASEEEREMTMEIVTSWMEEGLQKGREEGLQKGMQQGMQQGLLQAVLRQLRHRFGELTPQLQERISNLSTAQLDVLTEALLDFGTLSDLQVWLEREAPSA